MKKLAIFQSKAEGLTRELRTLIDEMPYKGDDPSVSHKIYLIQKLNTLIYAFNGTKESDFEEGSEE